MSWPLDAPTTVTVVSLVGIAVVVVLALNSRFSSSGDTTLDVAWPTEWEMKPGADIPKQKINLAIAQVEQVYTFFQRRRQTSKRRAEAVIVGNGVVNALIAIIGVVVTFNGWSRLGIVSTALAALLGAWTSWDAHFRHRELWIQRTVMLSRCGTLRRGMFYRLSSGDDPSSVADDAMRELQAILDDDVRDWAGMREDQLTTPPLKDGAAANGPPAETPGQQ